jgi:hypothetical protein
LGDNINGDKAVEIAKELGLRFSGIKSRLL